MNAPPSVVSISQFHLPHQFATLNPLPFPRLWWHPVESPSTRCVPRQARDLRLAQGIRRGPRVRVACHEPLDKLGASKGRAERPSQALRRAASLDKLGTFRLAQGIRRGPRVRVACHEPLDKLGASKGRASRGPRRMAARSRLLIRTRSEARAAFQKENGRAICFTIAPVEANQDLHRPQRPPQFASFASFNRQGVLLGVSGENGSGEIAQGKSDIH